MTDFITEVPQPSTPDKESGKTGRWILHVDGASQSSGSGVGLLLESPIEEQLEQSIRLGFLASNNEVKYETILSGLRLTIALSAERMHPFG